MTLTPAQNLDAAILAKTNEIATFISRPDASGAAGNSIQIQVYLDHLQSQLEAMLKLRNKPGIDGISMLKTRGIT
jgi:hypothetical protein